MGRRRSFTLSLSYRNYLNVLGVSELGTIEGLKVFLFVRRLGSFIHD